MKAIVTSSGDYYTGFGMDVWICCTYSARNYKYTALPLISALYISLLQTLVLSSVYNRLTELLQISPYYSTRKVLFL
jgi:hypothetical protein